MGVSGVDYRVMIVSNEALPAGVERVMVEKRGQPTVFVIAQSAAENWKFLEAWQELHADLERADADRGGYYLRAV